MKEKRKPWIAGAAIFLCLLLAAGGLLYLQMEKRAGEVKFEKVFSGDASLIQKEQERRETLVIASASVSSASGLWKDEGSMAEIGRKLVYPGLAELDENRVGTEKLAEEIVFDESGTAAEVTLKEGITFSDGSGLNAEEVIKSYQAYAEMLKKEGRPLGLLASLSGAAEFVNGEAESLSGISQTGLNTIQFKFTEADYRNLDVLTVPLAKDAGERMIGCGEYCIEKENPRKEITLTRSENTNFHEFDYNEISFQYFTGTQIEKTLEDYGADVMPAGQETNAEQIKDSGWMSVYKIPASGYAYFAVSPESELLKKQENRQAVAQALDRRELKNRIYGEENGSVPEGIFSITGEGEDSLPYVGKEAGNKLELNAEGARRIRLKTAQDAFSLGAAQDIKEILEANGIQVELVMESSMTDDASSYDVYFEAGESGSQNSVLREFLESNEEMNERFKEAMASGLEEDPMGIYERAERFFQEEGVLLPVHCTDSYMAVAADCESAKVLRLTLS